MTSAQSADNNITPTAAPSFGLTFCSNSALQLPFLTMQMCIVLALNGSGKS